MSTQNPLLDLPLDQAPFRSPFELQKMVAPAWPNWLRRNHSVVDAGKEGPDDRYSLYAKEGRELYRLYVGVRPDASGEIYAVSLCRWDQSLEQTRYSIPWQVLAEAYFADPSARDAEIVRLMTMGVVPNQEPIRRWIATFA